MTSDEDAGRLKPEWTSADGTVVLYRGDCVEVMRKLPEASVDAIVCDPPYHLTSVSRGGSPRTNDPATPFGRTRLGSRGFMGSTWDGGDVAFHPETWVEVLRVAKPGAHLLAFGGSRTFYRLACAIEDAGWEIRDTLSWLYGCLDPLVELLTTDGWKRWSDIRVGQTALCYDVGCEAFSWGNVEEVYVYELRNGDPAYRVCGSRGSYIVTGNHRLVVECCRAVLFRRAAEVARECEARVPVLEDLPGLLAALCLPDKTKQDLLQITGEPGVVPQQPGAQAVRGSRYTRPDLVRIAPVEYTGVVWCVRVPTGAFVARAPDGTVFVTGNSGFPKSLDVSKAIDKAAGVEREVIGTKRGTRGADGSGHESSMPGKATGIPQVECEVPITIPATEEAARWDGWGTALRPCYEPIILARKPLDGTVAANVLKHGTGGINIDACRIPRGDKSQSVWPARDDGVETGLHGRSRGGADDPNPSGGWPGNLLLTHSTSCRLVGKRKVKGSRVDKPCPKPEIRGDQYGTMQQNRGPRGHGGEDGMEEVDVYECAPDCAIRMLDEQSGMRKAGGVVRGTEPSTTGQNGIYGHFDRVPNTAYGDEGGASRFFNVLNYGEDDVPCRFRYESKAPRSERDDGCDATPDRCWRLRLDLPPEVRERVLGELAAYGIPRERVETSLGKK